MGNLKLEGTIVMVMKLIEFLKTDLWRLRLKNYTGSKFFLLRQLRVAVLSVRGFAEDKCQLRASALTYFSLLSIVPVIAMMFGIAKGFGLEGKVREVVLRRLQGQEEVAERIIQFAESLLANTSGGFIAGVGVAFLFWAIIKVLSNIENSFNYIWGVKKDRHLGRKFSDYLSMMLVCPFLLVMSSSLTVMISGQVRNIVEDSSFLNAIGPVIGILLKLLPFCTIWITFTFLFIFMPNTRVKWKSGLLGGIVAGTIFQLVQWGYINFQVGAARYGAIYGSFAALPLFLLWLQVSWLIVLYGAEISFAHQNVDTYEFEQDCKNVSHSHKRLVSLLVSHLLVKDFCQGKPPIDANQISEVLEVPIRLVREVVFDLVESGILIEAKKNDYKDAAYHPGIDVNKLSIKFIVDALEKHGNSEIPIAESKDLDRLSIHLETITGAIEKSPSNVLLKDI
jgi:membrane protein